MTRPILARLVPVAGAAGALALLGSTAANAAVNTGVRRNSFDHYYLGAGTYRFCAKNALGLGVPVTNVSLTLRTDADA